MTAMTDPDAWIDATAPALGLAIDDAWRPGVVRFLGIAAEMAAILNAVELDDGEFALAPVYLPPEPRDE
jgi:hypothetical protein